jgi:carbon monoxide dehydrogenase subunit G
LAIRIPVDLGYRFSVRAPFREVFAVLSDVPVSVGFFPKVQRLVDMGRGTYRWEMQRIGVGTAGLQTVYASRYVADRAKGTVTWTPVEGVGNAQVGGSWKLTDRRKTTEIELRIHGTVEVPLPALMKTVAGPLVKGEFEKLVDAYVDNLIARFGGEA